MSTHHMLLHQLMNSSCSLYELFSAVRTMINMEQKDISCRYLKQFYSHGNGKAVCVAFQDVIL